MARVKPTFERHDALRRLDSLGALSDAEVDTLIQCVRERRLTAGQVVYQEGSHGDTMALVVEGTLSASRSGPGGSRFHLRDVEVGELVGELACIDPAPRSARVVAVGPAVILDIDRATLEILLERAPRIGSHLLGMIIRVTTQRLREVDRQISVALGEEPVAATFSSRRVAATKVEQPETSAWQKLVSRLKGGA